MPFFVLVSVVFLTLYLIDLGLLRVLHPRWWRHPWVRRATASIPVLATLGLGAWFLGYRLQSPQWIAAGAGTVSVLFAQLVGLLVALVVTAPLRLAELGLGLAGRRRRQVATATAPFPAAPSPERLAAGHGAPSPDRRRFLRAGLVGVPVATSLAALGGVWQSTLRPRLPVVPLRYPALPDDLQGLRVLQISDCHVGPYVDLDDLADLVDRATSLRPDLVVVTGDICDHMPDYQACLDLLEQIRPPLGTYASLGNHEYFRGIRQVRACFARSQIRLLVDEGVELRVGDSRLRIAGADDPQSMGDPSALGRLRASVARALDGADSDAFQLLLSHRSLAFDFAAPAGVHLTLAGHTHGFQIGLGGRSLFEALYPQHYLWGHYGHGDRQLYTSAGVGHWFPFRLGCPPEAPLFILETA